MDSSEYCGLIRSRIRTFESQYRQISKSVEMFGRYNTWVYFKCNNLVIDTASPSNKNIILQTWEYNKNGSGTANDFTLRICYNFSEATEYYKLPDIHYVEKALCLDTIVKNEEGKVKGFKSVSDKLKCKFRYGYINVGTDGTQLLSPEYEGMITGCVPELRDNMLFYTITGVSGAFGGKEQKFNFDAVSNKKATDLAYETLNKYYGTGFESSPFKEKISKPYSIIDKTGDAGLKSNEKEQDFGSVEGRTVFKYVSYILSRVNFDDFLKAKGINKDDIPEGKEPYCGYYIDDASNAIVIDIIDPSNILKKSYYSSDDPDNALLASESVKYDSSVVFEYPNKSQNFILSFTPSLDLKQIWVQTIYSDEDGKRWGIDDAGKLVLTNSASTEDDIFTITKIDNGDKEVPATSQIALDGTGTNDSSNEDDKSTVDTAESKMSATSFSQAVNQIYEATMSCMGIPADIPLQTRIKITPILMGTPYLFEGSYMVKKCSDRIDSSGYITEMSLLRLTS